MKLLFKDEDMFEYKSLVLYFLCFLAECNVDYSSIISAELMCLGIYALRTDKLYFSSQSRCMYFWSTVKMCLCFRAQRASRAQGDLGVFEPVIPRFTVQCLKPLRHAPLVFSTVYFNPETVGRILFLNLVGRLWAAFQVTPKGQKSSRGQLA